VASLVHPTADVTCTSCVAVASLLFRIVQLLVQKLSVPLVVAQCHILSSLNDISREREYGLAVVNAGALPTLLQLIDQPSSEGGPCSVPAAACINHLVRQESLRATVVTAGAVPVLLRAVESDDASLIAKVTVDNCRCCLSSCTHTPSNDRWLSEQCLPNHHSYSSWAVAHYQTDTRHRGLSLTIRLTLVIVGCRSLSD
jgi:hypothetical protein